MKTIFLTLLAAIAFAGCATSKTNLSGNAPSTTGPSAKSIWAQQLAIGSNSGQGKGTIRSVRGDHVSISSNNAKSFTPAKIGHTLAENAIAATGGDSQLDIFLADNGPVIRLTENTEVKFVRLGLDPATKTINTMLDLTKGRLLGFASQKIADLDQANPHLQALRLHRNEHEIHREIKMTPQKAWALARQEKRSVLRPKPNCPWWPFVWSLRTPISRALSSAGARPEYHTAPAPQWGQRKVRFC